MESTERPAWTSEDLHAYRHKHTARGDIIKDFFVKPCNQVGPESKKDREQSANGLAGCSLKGE